MSMPFRVLCLLGILAVGSISSDLSYGRGDLQGKNEQVTRVKEKRQMPCQAFSSLPVTQLMLQRY